LKTRQAIRRNTSSVCAKGGSQGALSEARHEVPSSIDGVLTPAAALENGPRLIRLGLSARPPGRDLIVVAPLTADQDVVITASSTTGDRILFVIPPLSELFPPYAFVVLGIRLVPTPDHAERAAERSPLQAMASSEVADDGSAKSVLQASTRLCLSGLWNRETKG
jgi:hypothetical protein